MLPASNTARTAMMGLVGLALTFAPGCGSASGRMETPETALARYQQAVQEGDVDAAYALLAEETRATVSAGAFRQLMADNRAELGEQAAALGPAIGAGVPARAEIALASGEKVVLMLEDGRWSLAGGVLSAPALSTPLDSVRALRRALARRSLPGIERVLARQTRADLADEIDRLLSETADELDLQVEEQGNSARVRTTGGREITLVRESGEWRVVEVD